VDLLPQLFLLKTPQYTKYSGVFKTEFGSKSLTQIIKKEFLEVACDLVKIVFPGDNRAEM
jgi:hypothetical protein